MANKKSEKLPSLFQSHGIWYFKLTVDNPAYLTNPDEPKRARLTFSTYQTNYKKAVAYRDSFVYKDSEYKATLRVKNLGYILSLFMDPATNPKMKNNLIEGKSYSEDYAKNVARSCRQLNEVLLDKMPHILKVKLTDISRKDCFDVREAIFDTHGNNHVAREAFKKFKMAMMYAADNGLIPFSPAEKIDNIKAKDAKPVFILSPEDVVAIYSIPELFQSEEARAQFMVFATTGMRRSELGALTVEQVYKFKKAERLNKKLTFYEGWAISIDRSFKNNSWSKVGLPKWDKTRCIPIADVTYRVLEPFLVGKAPSDRVFSNATPHTFKDDFNYLRNACDEMGVSAVLSCPAAMENLSPHKLRHGLNTLLTTSDIKDVLTNEYMSWEKQKKDNVQRMQSHYTHINVSHLAVIANFIDEMFCDEVEGNLIPFTVNG